MDDVVEARLTEVVSAIKQQEVMLVGIGEFPGVIWLRPDPVDWFREITQAIWAAFPKWPPYEGRFPDSQPHVTVALNADPVALTRLRQNIESDLGASLPVVSKSTGISLFQWSQGESWKRISVFPFRGVESRNGSRHA